MRYTITIVVTVEAVSEDAAKTLVEDACNGYKDADIEIISSDAEED